MIIDSENFKSSLSASWKFYLKLLIQESYLQTITVIGSGGFIGKFLVNSFCGVNKVYAISRKYTPKKKMLFLKNLIFLKNGNSKKSQI